VLRVALLNKMTRLIPGDFWDRLQILPVPSYGWTPTEEDTHGVRKEPSRNRGLWKTIVDLD